MKLGYKDLRNVALATAALVFLTAVAPASPGPDKAAAEAAIRAGTAAWLAAYNSGKVDAIVAMYVDDAVAMPPGAPAARGLAAIRQFLVKDIAGAQAGGITIVLGSVNDVAVFGDHAWHAGSYSVVNKAGATVDTGNYLETWRRTAGKWQIVRDIWNSDRPAPAPAPAAPATK